ncbi:lysine N(6)-hydroxylase/L-ornithine N(5)-oxygenase family protein [Pseudonocardia abyssalis]|uniref:Lysine N(6)-hydroxylase/L-ornithine N(5)-oxygenase family protein n=1 Tax=Pseudonocardia abyssalis TaxID=2792008 RepID=A0ABS6UQX8_9PSEU|nr:SidA/IucD/PvdA family monooxygenase [Pseudonocardia abyssalis]MBW0117650.1 lysine N(6)-hydroxylase/L-ornithine N(5)-oxygenase family protein [Pseudonocardia abyssalis]MBW0134671.1 lysine N(6)-hydroxylase/L-ornithine N(5)-oxygenase family protein [Pseudonocardia abyssalis]
MPQVRSADAGRGSVHDLVGIGFGPSNLALAIAAEEYGGRLAARFVERQTEFGWHRGMLIEDATMQVSFLKDLATLRNPTSRFGFLSYLHDRDRLVDFINYGTSFPTRLEFHDYLEWAAAGFADRVDYGTTIVGVEAVPDDPEVLDVRTEDGGRLRTRNVVLATGLVPHLPEGVSGGRRVWHSRDLVAATAAATEVRRVIVVGAGQSAAEAADHLHRTFPDAEVCAVFARYGYSPADDSSFANRVFDPGAVDDFFQAPSEVKDLILAYHGNTNYSVVDLDLIQALYRRHYHEKVSGRERLRFLNVSRVADVVETDDRVELAVESLVDRSREVISADLVVYATGYRPSDPVALLGGLAPRCRRDRLGRLDIGRDYRVATDGDLRAGIYVQGATEHTHGLSSTLLSNVAVRTGEIAASIVARKTAHRPADLARSATGS